MMEAPAGRWLILEQESDCSEWCHKPCRHLIWNGSSITQGDGVPSHRPAEHEIRILFLPVRHSNWKLTETYSNCGLWQWNVWCHYGRDITLAELNHRWHTYERLDEASKALLSRDSTRPPLPYSRSMAQPWSKDFHQFKAQVREIKRKDNTGSFDFCLNLLKHARALATGNQDTQERLEQAREALPAVLAARYLLGALPKSAGPDSTGGPEVLRQILDVCQHSGLMAMAHRKERFSGRVRESYRRLCWIVVRLHVLQDASAHFTHGTEDLERLRWALQGLLRAADDEAATTSQTLMKDS